MQPVIFNDPSLFVTLVNRIAAEPIFDDNIRPHIPDLARNAMFFYIESVPGIALLHDIIIRREATCTLILFERPGKRYKILVRECRDILSVLMQRLQLKRIATYTSSLNKQAQRMAADVGFQRESVNRLAMCIGGQMQDLVTYVLFAEDHNGIKNEICRGTVRQADRPGAKRVEQLDAELRDAKPRDVPVAEPVPQLRGQHVAGHGIGWAASGSWSV